MFIPVIELWRQLRHQNLDAIEKKNLQNKLEAETEIFENKRDELTIERCEFSLSPSRAEGVYALWGELLYATQYEDQRPVSLMGEKPPPPIFIDGTNYHFYLNHHRLLLAGRTHSSSPDSNAGQFAAITDLMKQACLAKEASDLHDLQIRVNTLYAQLKTQPQQGWVILLVIPSAKAALCHMSVSAIPIR